MAVRAAAAPAEMSVRREAAALPAVLEIREAQVVRAVQAVPAVAALLEAPGALGAMLSR